MVFDTILLTLANLSWWLHASFARSLQAATHWRNASTETIDARLQGLKSGDKAYRRALLDFHQFCVANRLVLIAPEDVDLALTQYCLGVRRAKAETIFSAMLRAYPPLKGRLAWTASLVHELSVTQPTCHHAPMPWGVALIIAHRLRGKGHFRRAVALLLQWRLGVRPGELLQLRPEDIQYRHGQVSLVALGMRRGTKVRRRAAIRIAPEDWRSAVLLHLIVSSFGPGAPLTDWKTVTDISNSIKLCCREAGLEPRWTAHCPRAGWATAQYISGTLFSELMDMGRWSSPTSLRIYLDVVASDSVFSAPDVAVCVPLMNWLDSSFVAHWGFGWC